MKDKLEYLGCFTAVVGIIGALCYHIRLGVVWRLDSEAVCWRCHHKWYEPDVQHNALHPGFHSAGLRHPRYDRQIFQEFSN